jgi:predicted Rossmann-fold nucleotide-binding protein
MRVLVCGGRNYSDTGRVISTLENIHTGCKITCLIEGGATGADEAANRWARASRIMFQTFPADWRKYGKAAGAIRNALMLSEGRPDLVIAFPGGAGTANMVKLAKYNATKVMEIKATPVEFRRELF